MPQEQPAAQIVTLNPLRFGGNALAIVNLRRNSMTESIRVVPFSTTAATFSEASKTFSSAGRRRRRCFHAKTCAPYGPSYRRAWARIKAPIGPSPSIAGELLNIDHCSFNSQPSRSAVFSTPGQLHFRFAKTFSEN